MDANQNAPASQKERLAFYGGPWMSFLPYIIFIALILVTTFHFGSISDGALWLPAFIALLLPFFLAKDKGRYAATLISGMASREAITPVVCWLFAGVFSRILRDSGLAAGVAGLAAGAGVSGAWFSAIAFIASAVFATASGTGFGTIAAGMGVLYPAGLALGAHPGILAGAIISGAAFGDNLAPISDTTICSATSQGVDVPGVVRSRLKYALVAGALTLAAIFLASAFLPGGTGDPTATSYNPLTLLMFIPVLLTIYLAAKSGDIVIATTVGIVAGVAVALGAGLMDFIQIDVAQPALPALITVSGEGLDRAVGGVLQSGLSGMIQVCILALLLSGATAIMRAGGGDRRLLALIGRVAKGPRGTELTISLMVIALSALMGLNAPAILAIGASFALPLAKKQGISPYRTANLLDAQSNTLCYCLPWTPAMVYTLGFAADTATPLTAAQVSPFVFYSFAMLAVMLASIFLGIGRQDGLEQSSKGAKKRWPAKG
ncbi:sodium:proton antiporter [Christensenellaceae bacterium NSJ-44]|uniref:Sodium:proton antiporter n=1 Tax=Luoshenia tenuis TaxID=2763654 RepID=A0A926CZD0_9FIRM|nr:Na+/H+ antiporter NhaC family protein [Luoshenia tenuis]MBC8528388.1 sodium:proton antiporter [Luoshenia tenuis]